MGEVKGTKLLRKGYVYIYIYIYRISVFGPRPYFDAVAHLRVADHCNPIKLLIPRELQRFSQFYIVDSVISMLFTTSINVILRKVLLMVILSMLLPPINGFTDKGDSLV